MQLLEQLAVSGDDVLTETLFPNAKAKKIWFSNTCKNGKTAIVSANDFYSRGEYKKAKDEYVRGKNIFVDVKKEIVDIDGNQLVSTFGEAAITSLPPVGVVFTIWKVVRAFIIQHDVDVMLKTEENDVEIMSRQNYQNQNPISLVPKYKSGMLVLCNDIIAYCDAMIKKCSSGR